MSWLSLPGPDVVVPARFTASPVMAPRATAADAAQVEPVDAGEPLVPVAGLLATRIVYDELPLPRRDAPMLRAGVVNRLRAAEQALPEPFGLVVLDGWRSPQFQRDLLAHYRASTTDLADGWVSDPDAAVVPPHTTGGAVDLTLTWEGAPLGLGTDYDAFEADAHPAALEEGEGPGRGLARDLRRMLAVVLGSQGLVVYPLEWWHWSFGDQWWAAERGLPTCPYDVVPEAPRR